MFRGIKQTLNVREIITYAESYKITTIGGITRITQVGIWCQNDVVSTSMGRDHVASTLIRRQFMSCTRWVVSMENTLSAVQWPF